MIDLAYILSPGHSGSTVIGMMLGAHPSIATVGELKNVPLSFRNDQECSCGTSMRSCTFWAQVAAQLRSRNLDPATETFRTHVNGRATLAERIVVGQIRGRMWEASRAGALRVWPAARRHLRHTLACNMAVINIILEMTGRNVFLDTSKDASRLRYLAQSAQFRISVLHLIRDGRAVAYSLIRKGVAPRKAACEWVHEHEQAERLRKMNVCSRRWMQIRYEDFCADPDAALASMCEFVGVSREQRTLDFRSWDNHVVGNRLRLDTGNQIALDEKWRRELSGDRLRIVESVTRDMNRRYGYV